MAGERPINADAPPPENAAATPQEPQPRKPTRLAPKLIGAAVALAAAFLAAAILGGSHGGRAGPGVPAGLGTSAPKSAAPAAQIASRFGYPTLATKNTTRVGGADPASIAAAVALVTFPSTAPAQRPAAVTLAGEDDWQGAIAAAVLSAAPVRAPLLVSSPAAVPDPTAAALAVLDPRGSGATGGAQAITIGAVAKPEALRRVTAVSASGAAATAAAIERLRDRLFGAPPAHVVIASAEQPGFAMPAAAWAARSGDPVLFAAAKKLPGATAAALRRHAGVPVYVLGPPSAISAAVLAQIARIDGRVRRVSGKNPVTSAIALARYAGSGFGWNINDPGHGFVIARSDAPLDGAAAAPLSGSGTWGPLLLTDRAATLPPALRGYLLDVKPGYVNDPTRAFYNHIWVIGDEAAIGVGQQGEIDNLAELTKIGGKP